MSDNLCRSFAYCHNWRSIKRVHFDIHKNSKLWCWRHPNVRIDYSRWITWRANSNVWFADSNVWRIWLTYPSLWLAGKRLIKNLVFITVYLLISNFYIRNKGSSFDIHCPSRHLLMVERMDRGHLEGQELGTRQLLTLQQQVCCHRMLIHNTMFYDRLLF